MPTVLRTVGEVSAWSERARREGRVALVPTMGFLHEGHLTLLREARRRAERVAATVFVNPKQFGPNEDFSRYPRDLEGDLRKCDSAGAEVVFAPEERELYPAGFQTAVEVGELSRGLCGERRPGHFRGVATVVTKLLCAVRPHLALFGEKDYQQLQVIRALARDLDLGVEIVGVPTVREPDGLALSSRNAYLSAEDRKRALAIHRGMLAAKQRVGAGGRAVRELVDLVRKSLASEGLREDYVEIVDAQTLKSLTSVSPERPSRLLVAAFVGSTRLIDNIAL
ncbi:MAG: pantoate--beta-alanine ligase [Myxococcales bacterium]|nr:pantoate--beta-alanine ligase [Myxococcales bacterium]